MESTRMASAIFWGVAGMEAGSWADMTDFRRARGRASFAPPAPLSQACGGFASALHVVYRGRPPFDSAARERSMSEADSPLDAAIRRLDRAMASLEARVSNTLATLEARGDDLFDQDRAQLAADLDAARARERALEEVAAEASAALGRAAAEVRAALQAEG